MNLTGAQKEAEPLTIGQKVKIVHYPGNHPAIEIQAVIIRAEHPHYWIDTENQKGIKVNRKYLQT